MFSAMLFQGYRICAVIRLFDIIGTGKRSPFSPVISAVLFVASAIINSNSSSSSGHTQLRLLMLLLTTTTTVAVVVDVYCYYCRW